MGAPFHGAIASDPLWDNKPDCIISLRTDEVKSQIEEILEHLRKEGFTEVSVDLMDCVSKDRNA